MERLRCLAMVGNGKFVEVLVLGFYRGKAMDRPRFGVIYCARDVDGRENKN